MKKYLFLLLLTPFHGYCQWQTLAMVKDSSRFNTNSFKSSIVNYSVAQPRFRISRSASLTLTTSWQAIDFSGSSSYNTNTFPIDPVTSLQQVSWDGTNKLVKFNMPFDVNHIITFYGQTTTSLISTRATIQVRFTIPNGLGVGNDLHFPFPDGLGYVDLWDVTLFGGTPFLRDHAFSVYINNQIRTNGLKVEVKLSNALIALGVSTLDNCALLINSTNSIN